MSTDLFPEVKPHNGVEDDNQRYTTDEADAWLRSVAGVDAWDLDVAACSESHRASRWYGLDRSADGLLIPVDGLESPWFGRVFCNPPWDDIEPWVKRAFHLVGTEPDLSLVAFLLPANRTHRPWWRKWVEPLRDGRSSFIRLDSHFAPKRFAYGGPGNPRAIGVPEPNFTTVGLIWRQT